MTFTIKYSIDGKLIAFNSYQEIYDLPDFNRIIFLNCSRNNLEVLPETLPSSLQSLLCNHNRLLKLPESLPKYLKELNCSHNQLTKLTLQLPSSLQILWCCNNHLTELPLSLPSSLKILNCSDNHVTELSSSLPPSLQILNCCNNNLVKIPTVLPPSLQLFNCDNNKLVVMPLNLPKSLKELTCSNNKLTSLPGNLHEFRNLMYFNYEYNDITYIPPNITRFLKFLKNKQLSQSIFYNDEENIHNHQIQESIRNSIYLIIKDKPTITLDKMHLELINSETLTEETKRLLIEYCEDDSIHSVTGITFKELLLSVWNIICEHKEKDEILDIMNIEMNDSNCKCFTGKISRLINCLNGYDKRVEITMAENDQISNIIIIEKEKLEKENNYNIEIHKNNVYLAMEERGYKKETIKEWIEYIE